jgi:hypothetical protein
MLHHPTLRVQTHTPCRVFLRICLTVVAGRGAPEIDVLEYGKLGANGGLPTYVHTMQMGPVLPPYTSWYSADGTSGEGIRMPGKGTDFETHLPNYRGALSRDGYPRTGEQGWAAVVGCLHTYETSESWWCMTLPRVVLSKSAAMPQLCTSLALCRHPATWFSNVCTPTYRQHCDRHLHRQQLPQG